MQKMQTVRTKCNVFEVAAVGLYSSLKMRKHLSANGQSKKWDSHACSPNSHFVQPIPTLRRA